MKKFLLFGAMVFAVAAYAGQEKPKEKEKKMDPATCPMHEEHMKAKAAAAGAHDHSFAEMNKRGEDAMGMGFSQTGTVHHFLLARDGGAIQVEVRDAQDRDTLAAVRSHLQLIAESFSKGDFTIPNFVHGKAPDGIAEMQKQKEKIAYVYEELPAGARVNIRTREKKAQQAVQSFLRFQITEHQTGDPLTIAQ